ncbi:hypothetical protein [uncultured Methylobacterium sp.]|uniref:hypothetical protein n=1 Tax=uncultured Methylobacterium sp. TaxID=157278 RepID=UPI0035CC8853
MTFGETVASNLISSFAVGIVFGATAAYFTTWLAFKRYKLEKWWDKKASAYEAILNNLFEFMFFFEKSLEAHMTDREPSQAVKDELQKKSEEAHRSLRKAAKIGSFVISDKAENFLVILERKLDKAIESQVWYDFIDSSFDAATNALDDLRDEARRDLSLEPSLPLANLSHKTWQRVRNRSGHADLGAPREG